MATITAARGPNGSVSLTRTAVTGATEYQWERRIGSGPWERFLDQGQTFDEYSLIPGPTYTFRARGIVSGIAQAWGNEATASSYDAADIASRGFIQVLIDAETPWTQYLGQWAPLGKILDCDRTSGVVTGGLFDPIQPTRFGMRVADFADYLQDTDVLGAKLWVALTIGGERYDVFTGFIQDANRVGLVDFDTGIYQITAFDVRSRFVRIPLFVDFATPSSVSGYINAALDKAGDVFEYDESGEPTTTLAVQASWPDELRDIEASSRNTTLAALSAADPVSLAQLIQYAEVLDLGVTFVTPGGVVRYVDRNRLVEVAAQTAALQFTDATQTFISNPVTIARSFGEVINITTVRGGTPALPLQFVSIDQASINRFGPREFTTSVGPLLGSEEDARTVALTRTSISRSPTTDVTFDWTPEADDRISDLLSLGLTEPVTVNASEYNLGGNFIVVSMRLTRNTRGVWRATIRGRQPEVSETWELADSYDLAAGGSRLHDSYYAPDYDYPAGVGPGSTNLGI